MPFATIALQTDSVTASLPSDGNGYLLDGIRWLDLDSVQYARVHYMASSDTPATTMTIAIHGYTYPSGVQTGPYVLTDPGPSVDQSAAVCIGPWTLCPPELNTAGDVKLAVYLVGNSNATMTVNWCEVQFR